MILSLQCQSWHQLQHTNSNINLMQSRQTALKLERHAEKANKEKVPEMCQTYSPTVHICVDGWVETGWNLFLLL